jgi:Phage integrase, N-terminal SAM-like domain
MSIIGPTLESYFAGRLVSQRQASARTISAYRDMWRLLLHFACQRSGKAASKLDFGDLDAPVIATFLSHLEDERGNTVRTRNTRLAAIHSFFRYSALVLWGGKTSDVLRQPFRKRGAAHSARGGTGSGRSLGVAAIRASAARASDAVAPGCSTARTRSARIASAVHPAL